MSVAMVSAGIGAVGMLASNANARSAASQASDANAAALDAQGKATGDRLAFDTKVYNDGAGDRQFASNQARQAAQWQADDRTKYNALQDDQIARGKKYQGVQDKILTDAENFDTEGKREELAGKAIGDVNQGFDAATSQVRRNQERMGINPSSGRAMATENAGMFSKALGIAGAASKARADATTVGYARKMDAAGFANGTIGNQATQASLALQSGNSSVNNSLIPLAVSSSANGAMSTGYGNAAGGYQNLGNTQAGSFYGSQNYGAGVGQSVGNMFGNIAGMGLKAYQNWNSGSSAPMGGWSPNSNSASTNDAMSASLLANGYGTGP
jgi:hypothetical protein